MRARRGLLLVVACGCGQDPANPTDGGTGQPDAPGPCTLPSLTLNVATLAGCTESGTIDGPRGRARFANPTNVAIARDGRAFVTDFDSDTVRIVHPGGETVTLVQRAGFKNPFGIALGAGDTLYVETDDNDLGAHTSSTGTVWRVDVFSGTATVIARDLGRPRGLAVLGDGRIAMADHVHHTLSILDPATGQVTPLAGALDQAGHANATGADARFAQPYDVVLMSDGDLAVSDMDNHRIRRVTLAGVVTDLAGSETAGNIDGPIGVATFDAPQALALGPGGALFASDIKRHFIRRIAGGEVSTVAGDGSRGWLDSDAPRSAKLSGLEGMDADATRLVVADGNRGDDSPFHTVRVIDLSGL